MTVVRDTTASVEAVWNVLSDGWSYATWVVGASRIRAVDPEFPARGSRIHHSVGLWPAVLNDETRVLSMTEGREVTLEARGIPAGKATIVLRLTPRGSGCRIEMIEHARTLPFSLVPESVQRALVYPRNTEATRRLALLAERSAVPR
ncbi:SRPBCC family protein [Rhodococcus sp. MEB041]|uniref:SRPBCC family protein n=1 Tax=Rhodococcus sp. MEB041 TaxID=3040323 RepID=UPI00254DCBB7|nr:SRPBCC family protein [Rhodococcus sp. MEB041]